MIAKASAPTFAALDAKVFAQSSLKNARARDGGTCAPVIAICRGYFYAEWYEL